MQFGARAKAVFPFLIPYAIVLVMGIYPALFLSKLELHLLLNTYTHPIADLFFKYVTHLGDGLGVLIISLLFFFINFRASLYIGITGIISGLLAQFFKRIVFHDYGRPLSYFKEGELYLIEGVRTLFHHSFPSGHATAAFGLFLSLSFIMGQRIWSAFFLVLALVTAYSRVYLSHHFFQDIYVGSAIGSITAILVYRFFYLRYKTHPGLNQSLLTAWKIK